MNLFKYGPAGAKNRRRSHHWPVEGHEEGTFPLGIASIATAVFYLVYSNIFVGSRGGVRQVQRRRRMSGAGALCELSASVIKERGRCHRRVGKCFVYVDPEK